MKRNRFIVLLSLLFLAVTASGQSSNSDEVKTGSFSCKAKTAKGKSSYLMDECNVDFTYKKVVGSPSYTTEVQWSRLNEFTMVKGAKKSTVTYAQLGEYPDLQKRFEMITPTNAVFDFTILFYSTQSDAYIASAKSRILGALYNGGEGAFYLGQYGKWYKVDYNGIIGYCHIDHCHI